MVEGDIGIRMPVIGGPDPTERDLEKKLSVIEKRTPCDVAFLL